MMRIPIILKVKLIIFVALVVRVFDDDRVDGLGFNPCLGHGDCTLGNGTLFACVWLYHSLGFKPVTNIPFRGVDILFSCSVTRNLKYASVYRKEYLYLFNG